VARPIRRQARAKPGAHAAVGLTAEVMPVARVDPSQEAFAAVLTAARTGAPWACRELWDTFAPAVAAFARARGSKEPDDLTSEVFLAVFDRLDRFEGDLANFRSFVFTVAHHRLVDEFRTAARRPVAEELSEASDPRLQASAEADALDRIADQQVRALLEELAPDQRDVLLLRIVGDLTVDEIAKVLGKRTGAVKALQRRGLEALRKKILPGRTLFGRSDDDES
jgi:RNA polymerase sigma factor (sigma-70 family)